jgi:hypothetical protein
MAATVMQWALLVNGSSIGQLTSKQTVLDVTSAKAALVAESAVQVPSSPMQLSGFLGCIFPLEEEAAANITSRQVDADMQRPLIMELQVRYHALTFVTLDWQISLIGTLLAGSWAQLS